MTRRLCFLKSSLAVIFVLTAAARWAPGRELPLAVDAAATLRWPTDLGDTTTFSTIPFETVPFDAVPGAWFDPTNTATTGVGGGTFDLNAFVGADRYYGHSTPITGQNTVAFNLEAGHFWNGHETLAHVATNGTNFVNSADTWGDGTIAPLYDRHATWAAMLIGGRQTELNPQLRQQGIAPGTTLRSAAIATEWFDSAYSLSFDISGNSYVTAYVGSFGTADVVNSSYGYGDPGGLDTLTVFTDAMSFQSPGTLHVVSAGNSGPAADTVGAPGSGYNTLTVAALGGANGFDTVASFSSRGPQTFAYFSGTGTVTVSGVRAAVDLAAPGESITSAFYGGQNGGNNTSLADSIDAGSNPAAYTANIAGTSFAAPIVAGGAALVASAAKTLEPLAGNPDATQSVVVKSLLLTGADKTSGWDNGQQTVTFGADTFIETTQSLDWAAGAGRLNLDQTFEIQLLGQTDVAGTTPGLQGAVAASGWDYGVSIRGTNNDYVISSPLAAASTLTTTLSWLRIRDWNPTTGQLFEIAQADLNLSVWSLGENDSFTSLVGRSVSLYNTVEHLSFAIPAAGRYGLRVEYPINTFDNTTGGIWGTGAFGQDYGLAWVGVPIPVPEPAAGILAAGGLIMTLVSLRKHRGRGGCSPPGFDRHATEVGHGERDDAQLEAGELHLGRIDRPGAGPGQIPAQKHLRRVVGIFVHACEPDERRADVERTLEQRTLDHVGCGQKWDRADEGMTADAVAVGERLPVAARRGLVGP
jgi:hypothetical protein